MRIIGLDPGLRVTGWGIIDQTGNRLTPIAHGTVKTTASLPLAQRLVQLEKGLVKVIAEYGPDSDRLSPCLANLACITTVQAGLPMAFATGLELKLASARKPCRREGLWGSRVW